MVDVVRVAAPLVELHEVAHDRHEVILREHRVRRRRGEVQALVDLVAADAAEVVALGREEEPLERDARRLRVGRIARTEQRVDLLERVHLAGLGVGLELLALLLRDDGRARRVLEQGVLDERALGAPRRHEDLDLQDLVLAELAERRVVERLADVGDHLARLRVHGVHGDDAAHRALAALDRVDFVAQVDRHVAREHLEGVHLEAAEAVVDLDRELVAFLDEHLGLGARALELRLLGLRLRRVGGGLLAGELDVLGDDRADDLALVAAALELLGQVELADGEEEAEDVRVAPVAERAQERGGRELLLLVDVHVDDIMDVDRELDPRAAEGDDARRDQPLAVRVRALLEHDARRAVELADDDALGAVDDEGAEGGEQRELAEIDLLLEDVLRPLDPVHVLVDDELQRRLEGRGVGHVALDALLHRVLGLAERVALELERVVLVDVGDREEVLEDPFETDILAVVGRGIQLQQGPEGLRLDVEQVGHPHPLLELAEGDLLQ